jgi:phosphopantothenate---cysteine ligase (CTP)
MTVKRILVTAGSTVVPIDQVRAISNIFRGRTGVIIAKYFADMGHEVTLINSNLSLLQEADFKCNRIKTVIPYKTYDQLYGAMEDTIRYSSQSFDVIIHSAAVSDYSVDGVYLMLPTGQLVLVDRATKVSSEHCELYLRMVQTEKIVDLIREHWGFSGYLVKFKLQVGITDEELLAIAEKSRIASRADMIVANCLEWSRERAYVMVDGKMIKVKRDDLASVMVAEII